MTIANRIHETNKKKTRPLIKLFIAKIPNTIKSFLLQVSCNNDLWDFNKAAEESIWLCFIEDSKEVTFNAAYVSQSKPFRRKDEWKKERVQKPTSIRKKFCKINGEASHSTEECETLKKMRLKGVTINNVTITEAASEKSLDKEENFYVLGNTTNNHPPVKTLF